jgi:hypothetical protein
MEVEEQELEQSKHAPSIAPGAIGGLIPRLELGQVTIRKKQPGVPAVPDQKKNKAKKTEGGEKPNGPKAVKDPEVNKPAEKKPQQKQVEKMQETWAQRAAAPPPARRQPAQAQQLQCQGENEKNGDGFHEVKRRQKKEEMKPVPPGKNSMQKRTVTFKKPKGPPLSQKKHWDISTEVNSALFAATVTHFVRIQGVTKNCRGCLTMINTSGATADMLINYREIVVKAERKVDAGIVDIETNEPWERGEMDGVNFD